MTKAQASAVFDPDAIERPSIKIIDAEYRLGQLLRADHRKAGVLQKELAKLEDGDEATDAENDRAAHIMCELIGTGLENGADAAERLKAAYDADERGMTYIGHVLTWITNAQKADQESEGND